MVGKSAGKHTSGSGVREPVKTANQSSVLKLHEYTSNSLHKRADQVRL